MMIWLLGRTESGAVFLDQPLVSRQIDGLRFRFLLAGNTVCLQTPPGCQRSGPTLLEHGQTLKIRYAEGEQVVLACSSFEEGYDRFQRLCLKETVSLGGSIEDDLYLQDVRIPAQAVVLHPLEKKMTVRKEALLAKNGRPVSGQVPYAWPDHFQMLNLQFVVQEKFLMISCPANLFIRLDPFMARGTSALVFPPVFTPVPRYRRVSLSRSFSTVLEEPLPLEERRHNPLIFSIGPAMTMAAGSLTAGDFSVQQALMNGRSLAESIPVLLMPVIMLAGTVLWQPLQRRYEKRQEEKRKKERLALYQLYLNGLKKEIETFEEEYEKSCREVFTWDFRDIQKHLFQTFPRHQDWLKLRLGRGAAVFSLHLEHSFQLSQRDPLRVRLENLCRQCTRRPDTTILLDLAAHREIYVHPSSWAKVLVLDLLLQFAVYFPPSLAGLVVLADSKWFDRHVELGFLPQTWCHGLRLFASSDIEARQVRRLVEEKKDMHFLVLNVHSPSAVFFSFSNCTLLTVEQEEIPLAADGQLRLEKEKGVFLNENGEQSFLYDPPAIDIDNVLFACLQAGGRQGVKERESPSLLSLYDFREGLDFENLRKESRESLAVPIGRSLLGETMKIDLHEKGHGPHGLIAGMTGSGKSELLLSLLLGLMMTRSPRDLQVVLIDFKGGGLIHLFENENYRLAHIAATLSNLDTGAMERTLASLKRECRRREEAFKRLSTVSGQAVLNLDAYQRIHADWSFAPLASLLVVIDEFAELKKEHPEFMSEIMSLARVGRSLGLHLLLATQKPGGIVDDQIWANCRFKIALKVQSRQDSLEVLQSGEAASLRNPGEFYMLCDGMRTYVKGAYASGPYGHVPPSVALLDRTGTIKQRNGLPADKEESEAAVILEKLRKTDPAPVYPPLWQPMPETCRIMDPARPPLGIGLLDDIENGTTPWYLLKRTHTLMLSVEKEVRNNFLAVCAKVLVRDENEKALLVSLNGGEEVERILKDHACRFSCVQREEEARIRLLTVYIHHHSALTCWLLLGEAGTVVQQEELAALLMRLLREETGRVHVVAAADLCASLPHRFRARFVERIACTGSQEGEASALFESAVHHACCSPWNGLVRRGKEILECVFPRSEEKVDLPLKNGRDVIPVLPGHIPRERIGDLILLGRRLDTFAKVYWPSGKLLRVVALYEEELAQARMTFSGERSFRFLSLKLYQQEGNTDLEKDPVLFIGAGYGEQYVFACAWKKPLEAGQGILFAGLKREVMQLVEGEENGACDSDLSDAGTESGVLSGGGAGVPRQPEAARTASGIIDASPVYHK
jgi:S-DNA-T family DNA segregation ATPase FtsK/SpoIIIE